MNDQDKIIWLDEKVSALGLRGLARELGLDPGSLHRDLAALKAGTATKIFDFFVTARMEVEEREVRVRDLMNQLSHGDEQSRARIEELDEEIRELTSAVADAQALAAVEREARQDAARDFLAYWVNQLKRSGFIAADDNGLHGDAAWIIENGITNLNYANIDHAAVALGPDDYKFKDCRLTAAQLRKDISPAERLQRNLGVSMTRSERMSLRGARARLSCYRIAPDEAWFYGDDFPLVNAWRFYDLLFWKLRLGGNRFFDIFASPQRFADTEQFVLIRKNLEIMGYTFYSDYIDSHEESEESYIRMKRFSAIRRFWPLTSPRVVSTVAGGVLFCGLMLAIVAVGAILGVWS